jgi:hypothetical protein
MRKLVAFVARSRPTILAVSEIGSGDSRSLATRFAMQWAYRGRQAVFWSGAFTPGNVAASYLPSRIPVGRRGLVRVDGEIGGARCTLAATQFSRSRDRRAREIRFVRARLQSAADHALFFAQVPPEDLGLSELGFREEAADAGERIYALGFGSMPLRALLATV